MVSQSNPKLTNPTAAHLSQTRLSLGVLTSDLFTNQLSILLSPVENSFRVFIPSPSHMLFQIPFI
jgi:hypothetical protein